MTRSLFTAQVVSIHAQTLVHGTKLFPDVVLVVQVVWSKVYLGVVRLSHCVFIKKSAKDEIDFGQLLSSIICCFFSTFAAFDSTMPWLILLVFLFGFVLIVFLVRISFVVVTVESQSMTPALKHGDRVLVWRYWPAKWLRKHHIVLVWPSEHRNGSKPFGVIPFIKRVVGLPGDVVTTHIDELHNLHKNKTLIQAMYDDNGMRIWYVPKDHFFVRGDHPIGGFDSLTWGPIPFSSLLGIVIMRLPRLNKYK